MSQESFVDYCYFYYGPNSVLYPMGATKEQIVQAIEELHRDKTMVVAFDSVDRERVRDILIEKFGLVFPTCPNNDNRAYYRLPDGRFVTDLEPQASVLMAVVGPEPYTGPYDDECPDGFEWFGVDEWAEHQAAMKVVDSYGKSAD